MTWNVLCLSLLPGLAEIGAAENQNASVSSASNTIAANPRGRSILWIPVISSMLPRSIQFISAYHACSSWNQACSGQNVGYSTAWFRYSVNNSRCDEDSERYVDDP